MDHETCLIINGFLKKGDGSNWETSILLVQVFNSA